MKNGYPDVFWTYWTFSGLIFVSCFDQSGDDDNKDNKEMLKKLGKHKLGGGCLYINKLSDVDQKILATLIEKSFQFMKKAGYKDLISG